MVDSSNIGAETPAFRQGRKRLLLSYFCQKGASLFQQAQLFAADAGGNTRAVQFSNVKTPGGATAENKTFFALAGNLVKQSESFDFVGRLIALAHPALENRQFVNLPIVAASLFLEEELAKSFGSEIAGYAEGVSTMRLGDAVQDSRVLRQVAVGAAHLKLRMRPLQAVQYRWPHDAHEGFCPEGLTPLRIELDLAPVICLVARLAERDQIAGRVAASTSAFQVMNIEHRVFRSAVTMLTNMPVSEENVLANVPEAELFTFLVLLA